MQQQDEKKKYASSFKEQCSIRALVLGVFGSILITTGSLYVALRLGALPWPTIFAALFSMAILKAFKYRRTNLNEINTAHTAMSAGSMVAGGLAFTIPGIWIIDKHAQVSITSLLAVTLSGVLLGVLFTAYIRKYFMENGSSKDRKAPENYPFPIGRAAAETLLVGDEGGQKAKILFSSLSFAALFVILRDALKLIPNAWNWTSLAAKNISLGISISPMAMAVGCIIGPLYTGVWFLGALISHLFIVPVGLSSGWFADIAAADAFKISLGIGLMIGTGVGILLKGILQGSKGIYGRMFRGRSRNRKLLLLFSPLVSAAVILLLTIITGMGVWSSLITILGVWLTTAVAASITGQTGINPMEIFGILVMLAARAVAAVGGLEAFFISGVVAVACGLAGDVLNDFKSGHILKTDPKAQIIAEGVGGITGAIVSVLALVALLKSFGAVGPGTSLIAPQATAVSSMLHGLPDARAFWIGSLVGFLLYILKIPGLTLGLGVFLPVTISSAVFIGGMVGLLSGKIFPSLRAKGNDKISIIAAGLLGGEGTAGVLIAIGRVVTMS